MFIKEIKWQHRRDFDALIECEFCQHKQILESGYDDAYYHNNVLPNVKCKACEKSSISGKSNIAPRQSKYPEGFQI